jgi:hypothetical protein
MASTSVLPWAGKLLLEREAQVAALEALADGARSGGGRFAVIEGSAGIGKTRLLAEARAIAGSAGMRVLAARGGELESEFTYGIVRQLFEPLLASAAPISARSCSQDRPRSWNRSSEPRSWPLPGLPPRRAPSRSSTASVGNERVGRLAPPSSLQTPSASMIKRAAAAPECCCWPVIRSPSRTACGLKREAAMKFVSLSFFASSSIRKGWTRCPTNSST